MKKLLFLGSAMLLAATAMLAGCSDDAPAPPRFEMSVSSLIFDDQTAGSQTLAVEANCDWTVDASTLGWATVTPASGTGNATLTVTPEALPLGTLSREGSFSILLPEQLDPCRVTVKQSTTARFSVSVAELAFDDASAPSLSVAIETNCAWSVNASALEWAVVTPLEGVGDATLTVTPEALPLGIFSREGVLVVAPSDGDPVTVAVTQSTAPYFRVLATELVFDDDTTEKSLSVGIETNCAWSVDASALEWAAVVPLEGVGDATLTVTPEALPLGIFSREGALVIAPSDGDPVTVAVRQSTIPEQMIWAEPSSLEFDAGIGGPSIEIQQTIQLKAYGLTADDMWLSYKWESTNSTYHSHFGCIKNDAAMTLKIYPKMPNETGMAIEDRVIVTDAMSGLTVGIPVTHKAAK